MRMQLIRIHEDGTCARWPADPNTLRLILVIPAKPPRREAGVAS